jgi:hypothetical protein
MQTLLSRNPNPDLRAYFIWGPYLTSDTVEIARADTAKFMAPSASYFWTPSDRLARELASLLKLPSGRLAWDVYLVYGKGVAWEKTFPAPAYWQHQIGVIQGEPLNMPRFQSKIQELLR